MPTPPNLRATDLLTPGIGLRESVVDPLVAGIHSTAPDRPSALMGPVFSALTTAPDLPSTLGEQLDAEAALAALPAALLASVARPYVDRAYSIIDKYVPAAIRRPLERDLGLLIDMALTQVGNAVMPLVGASIDHSVSGGDAIPPSADVPIQGFSQMVNACGETAAATILKAAGQPVALADVDTQMSGFDGTSALPVQELRRRGLTAIQGSGDMATLRALVSLHHPVLVFVGWEHGGGHFAVVSGYNESQRTLTIQNWYDGGGPATVSYADFEPAWARQKNTLTAIVGRKDPRVQALLKAGDLRRPDAIAKGFSLSDFWVSGKGDVFVEGAFRYVTSRTDITVRVNFNSNEEGLARQVGGTLTLRQRVADRWYVGFTVHKLSVRGVADDWHDITTMPLAAYGTVEGPGFKFVAGEERGGWQASMAADLSRVLKGLGLQVNVAGDAGGHFQITGTLAGTF